MYKAGWLLPLCECVCVCQGGGGLDVFWRKLRRFLNCPPIHPSLLEMAPHKIYGGPFNIVFAKVTPPECKETRNNP